MTARSRRALAFAGFARTPASRDRTRRAYRNASHGSGSQRRKTSAAGTESSSAGNASTNDARAETSSQNTYYDDRLRPPSRSTTRQKRRARTSGERGEGGPSH